MLNGTNFIIFFNFIVSAVLFLSQQMNGIIHLPFNGYTNSLILIYTLTKLFGRGGAELHDLFG